MRAKEFITEITRRDLLRGAGAAAIGSAMPAAQAGEFQSWSGWKDSDTLIMWNKRWKQLNIRVDQVYAKLRSMLTPEQLKQIGKLSLEVGETWSAGSYKDGVIMIDLSIFWDLGNDPLAYTIAHEMGHAFYKHNGYANQTTAQNRKNELLADAFGAKLAYSAGYDPNKSFGYMTKKEKIEDLGNKTHPGYKERVNYIKQQTDITVSHIKRGVDLIGVPMSQIAQA
jgi:hypothetical protein